MKLKEVVYTLTFNPTNVSPKKKSNPTINEVELISTIGIETMICNSDTMVFFFFSFFCELQLLYHAKLQSEITFVKD